MSKLSDQLTKSTRVIAANTKERKAQRKRDAWQRIVLAFAVGAALLQSSVLVANRIAAADAASRAVWVFVALMVLVAVVVLILAGTTGVQGLRDMYRHEMTPVKKNKTDKTDKEEKK